MRISKALINPREMYMPRRQFVKGMAMGGALLGLGISPMRLLAGTKSSLGHPTLRGKRFNMNLAPQAVNFTGSERVATAVNGSVPGPILRWQQQPEVR